MSNTIKDRSTIQLDNIGDSEQNDLIHLGLALRRIDILIRREVRRWVLAGQDPNDDYRGMYVPQSEAETLIERPFAQSWGQWVALPPEEEVTLQHAYQQAASEEETAAQQMEVSGHVPRLVRLVHDFELDDTALDILLLCIAPAFDTKYERLYGYLQDNVTRRRPSVRLVLDLLGEPGVDKFSLSSYLAAGAPLFQFGLLEHVIEPPPANAHWLNQTLHADETVIAWLRGQYEHHGPLGEHVSLTKSIADDADQILAGDLLNKENPLEGGSLAPIIAFCGNDPSRQDAAARILANHNEQPLLSVNLELVVNEQNASAPIVPTSIVAAALRDARLTGSIAHLRGWDVCLNDDKQVSPDLLALLCDYPGPIVLASKTVWQPGGIDRRRRVLQLRLDAPDYEERLALWRFHLNGSDDAISGDAIAQLAGQFALTSGKIRDAVAAAKDAARDVVNGQLSIVDDQWSTDGGQPSLGIDDLFHAARAYSNPRLSRLARKVEPRFSWDDIILPDNQMEILCELVATVRQRSKVMEEWGVGKKLAASSGVAVLFAGPPGTGKTMAAEVIAGDLGLDLYKIDLSSVVSKYIGETEKNLERIFTEAASSNAILFFDEADSLFGKRTETKDAHDRYANLEISYLLQRMEVYDGVTILATNLRGNLDEAFTRRLHFAVDFPFPQIEDRLRIWKTLFPPNVPRADDLDLYYFAREFELAGGNIRNIIVSAAYLAADNGQIVTKEYLLHGAKRELQKMGRLADSMND